VSDRTRGEEKHPIILFEESDMSRDGIRFSTDGRYVWFISADLFLLNLVVYKRVEFSSSDGKVALPCPQAVRNASSEF